MEATNGQLEAPAIPAEARSGDGGTPPAAAVETPAIGDPAEALSDREVKTYFLHILDSDLRSADKYQRFIDFFKAQEQLRRRLLEGELQRANAAEASVGTAASAPAGAPEELEAQVARVARESGLWHPGRILEDTRDSIVRAVRRLRASRSPDSGWGFVFERSDCWGTAYAVLCLAAARQLREVGIDAEPEVDINGLLADGLRWLEQHPQLWAVRSVAPDAALPVYDAALAVRCFRRAGKSRLPAAAKENLDRLLQDQNDDGGWDAKIWGANLRAQARVYSEVGATAAALKALAAVGGGRCELAAGKAVPWLAANQNRDGGWNDGSRHPGETGLSGQPSINKTCDGLQGILIGRQLGLEVASYGDHITRAIEWLGEKETPILEDGRIHGWNWQGEDEHSGLRFENTCLTLETLVQVPEAPLPMLVANADWLIRNQTRADGDVQDGNWNQGHTARIALSLIEYYRTIAASPLFRDPGDG